MSALCAVLALAVQTGAGAGPPSAAPPAHDRETVLAFRIVELTNRERANAGLPPLKAADLLMKAAAGHAADMAARHYFSHTDQRGGGPEDRISAAGYRGSVFGENIAEGSTTPEGVLRMWMNSPGHRANILSREFREVGVGHAAAAGQPDLWVETLGFRDGFPLIINNDALTTTSSRVRLYIYGQGIVSSMRFSCDGVSYSAPEAYTPERDFQLPPGTGRRTVYVELRDAQGRTATTWDMIEVIDEPRPEPAPARPPRGASGSDRHRG